MEIKMFRLCTLLVFSMTGIYQARTVPLDKICRKSSCQGDQCPQVYCDHGQCSNNGTCSCVPCWMGRSCDMFQNEYYPEFSEKHLQAHIENSAQAGDVVYLLQAHDPDVEQTCKTKTANCDCAQLVYAIESGNEDELFQVGKDTGVITLTKTIASGFENRIFKLYVTVVNKEVPGTGGDIVGPKNFATLTVKIGSGSEYLDASDLNDIQSRQRRAAGPAVVNNITFTLIKTGNYNYTTTMYVGSKVHFQLQIQFPIGTMDLLVELFTPDNASTVMIVCDPQITWQGSAISFNASQAQPVLDSMDGTTNYDRAVLNFGNVTNSGTVGGLTNANQSMVFIEWDAVMINDDQTVNGSVYWVSAGAEYNSQNEIWIGQAGFTTILDTYNVSSSTPTFNMSGPSTMELGSSAVFHVDMYLPYPAIDLTFDAFAPVNYTDAMSVCSVIIVGVGENYECFQYQNLKYQLSPSLSFLTNDRGTLPLGTVVNKGSRESTPWTDNRISVEFTVTMPYNQTYIGSTMWLGSTLEIGTDQIWAGQIAVNITNATTLPNVAINPSFTMKAIGSTQAILQVPTTIEYNMTIPNNTETFYSLHVQVPANYKLCGIVLMYQGVNIPCMDPLTQVFVDFDHDGFYDQADWNLGKIKNTGQRPSYIDPQANVAQFYIYVVPLLSAVAGQVKASMTYTSGGASTTSDETVDLTIGSSTIANSVTNQTIPTANMTYKFGSGSVYVNQTTDIRLNISFYPGVIYTPFNISVTTPYLNGANVFSICRMEVTSVGKNLPCLNQTYMNSTITYTSMSTGNVSYQASLSAGSACSVALPPTGNATFVPTADDSVEIRLVVRVENHPSLVNGAINWVGAGFTYANGLMWVGAQALTAINNPNTPYSSYNVNATPYFEVDYTNSSSPYVPSGSPITFQVVLKIPPQSVSDWRIKADVGFDTDISICSVHVKQFGFGIPCLNTTTPMRYIDRAVGQGIKTGWLELYKLTNVGMDPNHGDGIFDNNTVVVEVIVQVSKTAVPGSTHGVNISADYGMNGVDFSTNMSFTATNPIPSVYNANAPMPVFNFSQAPFNSNTTVSSNVYKGQTLILTSDVTLPSGSWSDISVAFQSPLLDASLIDLVSYDVVFIGPNIPCIRKKQFTSNITSRPGSSFRNDGMLNLGTACNYPIDLTSPDNDKIRVEAIVTVVRNSSQTSGTFDVTSLLYVNGSQASSQSLTFTLLSSVPVDEYINTGAINMSVVSVNTSTPVVTMTPASYYTFYADITVLPNSSAFCLVDVALPMFQSAVMTVANIQIVSFGVNLGSFDDPSDFTSIYNSSRSTSQMDSAYINLGKITNTGHSYRSDKYQWGDNNIRILLTVQMADALVATDSSYWVISFGSKFGSVLGFTNATVQVLRTQPTGLLKDNPDILFNSVVNDVMTYDTTTQVMLNSLISHSNKSTSEGYNVTALFYLPKYTNFTGIISTNYTGPAPTIVNMTDSNSFAVVFDHLYFTDYVSFNISLNVKADVPGGSGVPEFTCVMYETVVNIIYRAGAAHAAGYNFASGMSSLNFTAKPPLIVQCPSVAPLGLGNKAIQDCQISGSLSPVLTNQPVQGRMNGLGWIPASRSGTFSTYFQVYFGNLTRVTSITLVQTTAVNKVTQYMLQYSNDGINWINGPTIIPSAGGTDTVPPPVMDSTYIRLQILQPTSTSSGNSFNLQIEFSGCITNSILVTPSDLCKIRNGWQESIPNSVDFYSRGFLASGSSATVFFCDTTPSGMMECYSSTDGLKWQALDKSVVNVNGFLASTNQLFGIDWNKQAFVMSEDNGATWMSISSARYAWAKQQPGYASSVNVKWDYTSFTSSSSPPAPAYIQNGFGAAYDGLYKHTSGPSWTRVADWMQCCP